MKIKISAIIVKQPAIRKFLLWNPMLIVCFDDGNDHFRNVDRLFIVYTVADARKREIYVKNMNELVRKLWLNAIETVSMHVYQTKRQRMSYTIVSMLGWVK